MYVILYLFELNVPTWPLELLMFYSFNNRSIYTFHVQFYILIKQFVQYSISYASRLLIVYTCSIFIYVLFCSDRLGDHHPNCVK